MNLGEGCNTGYRNDIWGDVYMLKKIRQIVSIILVMLFFWITAGMVDLSRVNHQKVPIFCIETKNPEFCHYSGLGYSFDTVRHPVSGNIQYAFYLFGIELKNNFTN